MYAGSQELLTVACRKAQVPTSVLQKSIALPDVHSGYGFAIGNVAAFDMADPESIVSPGGVGFDINCGVRLIRTNLVSTAANTLVSIAKAAIKHHDLSTA